MNRGNNKLPIYRDKEDLHTFLFYLSKAQEAFPYDLISYCLMKNHFHLQIGTLNHNLSEIIHILSLNYAKYFNKKYNLVGHLFQGRYIAELIKDDAYFIQTSKYIHLNPVKAKIVKNPIEYPWSSYGTYMGKITSDLVCEERILEGYFSKSRSDYRKYVERGLNRQSEVEDDMSRIVRNFEDRT